jgi:hypothetical protein
MRLTDSEVGLVLGHLLNRWRNATAVQVRFDEQEDFTLMAGDHCYALRRELFNAPRRASDIRVRAISWLWIAAIHLVKIDPLQLCPHP